MSLTATRINAAKPRKKPYKLGDSGGLFLLVSPSGGRWWRFKYRHDGKAKLISLGIYPETSLAQAREGRDAARRQLSTGVDPSAARQAQKAARAMASANSFEVVAREWFEKQRTNWVQGHADKIIARLERDVFPYIGRLPIADVTGPAILATIRRIEDRGRHETAHRALQNIGQIIRYAMATHRADRDPTYKLHEALRPLPRSAKKHFASIRDPKRIPALLTALDGYEGSPVTRAALRLAPLLFVRPGELRHAEWAEVSLDGEQPVWRIPAAKMKARREHIVPLAPQAVAILRELKLLTGHGRYLFPGVRSVNRPISNMTLNGALRRMGFTSDEMTTHGFRSMASTLLHEQNWPSHIIEMQLAHVERNEVKAAYNHASYLPERRKMMRAWAIYLDQLRDGGNVVPIRGRTSR